MAGDEKKTEEVIDTKATQPEGDDDDFGAAFDGAASETPPPGTKAEAPDKERAKEEEGETEDDKAKEVKAKGKKEPDETEPDEKSHKEDWEQKYKTLQGMFEQTQNENESLKTQLDESKKTGPDPSKSEDAEKKSVVDLKKLSEDDPDIKEFLEEYDYLAGPLQKILSKVVSPSNGDAKETVTKEELQEAINKTLYVASISSAHPDFTKLAESGELEKFANEYQGEDKDKIQKAYKEGTAEEIIWFLDQYKKGRKDTNGTSKAKDKKLKDMVAVDKKTTAINPKTAAEPDTFEAGFESAAARP